MKATTFFVCIVSFTSFDAHPLTGHPPTIRTLAARYSPPTSRLLSSNWPSPSLITSRPISSAEKIPFAPMSFLTLLTTSSLSTTSSRSKHETTPIAVTPWISPEWPRLSVPSPTSPSSIGSPPTTTARTMRVGRTSPLPIESHKLIMAESSEKRCASLCTDVMRRFLLKAKNPNGQVGRIYRRRLRRVVPTSANVPQPPFYPINSSAVSTRNFLWSQGGTNLYRPPPSVMPMANPNQNNPANLYPPVNATPTLSSLTMNSFGIVQVVTGMPNTLTSVAQVKTEPMSPNEERLTTSMINNQPIVIPTKYTVPPSASSRSTRSVNPLPIAQLRDEGPSYVAPEPQSNNIAFAPYAETSNWPMPTNRTKEVPTENGKPPTILGAWPLNTRLLIQQTTPLATQPTAIVMPTESEQAAMASEDDETKVILSPQFTMPPQPVQQINQSVNSLPVAQIREEGQLFAASENHPKSMGLPSFYSEPPNWPLGTKDVDTRPPSAPQLNPWSMNPLQVVSVMENITTKVAPNPEPSPIENYQLKAIVPIEYPRSPSVPQMNPSPSDPLRLYRVMMPVSITVPPTPQPKPYVVPLNAVTVNRECHKTSRPNGVNVHLALTLEVDYGLDITTTMVPPTQRICDHITEKMICDTFCEMKSGPAHNPNQCEDEKSDTTTHTVQIGTLRLGNVLI